MPERKSNKHVYFHCFSGISGDMILGALLDTGLVTLDDLQKELAKINLNGYSLVSEKTCRKMIAGTRLLVKENKNESPPLRTISSLLEILDNSSLDQDIKEKAAEIFWTLAGAEAKIHGLPVEKVHFHEIGAVDTVVDVVGCLVLLKLLGIKKVFSSPLHLGTGFIKIEHGTLPLPAPAVLELLRGVPVYTLGVKSELVTPTGAAILTCLTSSFGFLPPGTILASGYGAGSKELEHPNMLRAVILEDTAEENGIEIGMQKILKETSENKDLPPAEMICLNNSTGMDTLEEDIIVVEANIDDMHPEFHPYVMEKLLENGAWDVYFTPIHMKKNRPGVKLTVLCRPSLLNSMKAVVFKETSSLGLRIFKGQKYSLSRRKVFVETPYGRVGIKIGYLNGKANTFAPEYEDCRIIARKEGLPLKEIYRIAEECFKKDFDKYKR